MIVDIRIFNCFQIQYCDIEFENIVNVLWKNDDIVVCVYKGEEYYASIDCAVLRSISSQEQLLAYLDIKSIHGWLDGIERTNIEELFSEYKEATIIFLEKPEIQAKTLWAANKVEAPPVGVDYSAYIKLKQKGIHTYMVNLPVQVKNVYGQFCKLDLISEWMMYSEGKDDFKRSIENCLERITDITYKEYIEKVLGKLHEREQEKQLGDTNKSRTIFLIGPCIVLGASPSEKYLAELLNEMLVKNNLPYKIKKINEIYFRNEIMESDIFQNDIVIFIGSGLSYSDFDLTEDYEQYCGEKNLCTDHPMHASRAGCMLVADVIMNDIIIPDNEVANSASDRVKRHAAEKFQLPKETEYEVGLYLKRMGFPKHMRRGNNGAIVMNANPFTIGHRKLVEYASSRVDRLYVFVVEEDASFFSFEERFHMVVLGTQDISNVSVLASGNFIISNKTFYSYFTKEDEPEKKVDISQDILIFARYIAPYFGIKKRFVGDEPTDQITAQYNEQMKSILPSLGCELIEIPRFTNENVTVSGSKVRKAIKGNNRNYLKSSLPQGSLKYIVQHLDILQERDISTRKNTCHDVFLTDRGLKISELVNFIKKEEKIIIYGIGDCTAQLMRLLDNTNKEKLIFVDKKAEIMKTVFMGKLVLKPEQLRDGFLDYAIIILSYTYYRDIYFKCMDLGISKKRILYNPYNLFVNFRYC